MEFDSKSVPTCTPKTDAAPDKSFTLNISDIKPEMKGRKIEKTQAHRVVKKVRFVKENSVNEAYLEKRRKQAVEAMKIAEDRRHRLEKKADSPSENKENVGFNNDQFLPDGRLRLTRKQLNIRRDKHRRINEVLAEQKARKMHI